MEFRVELELSPATVEPAGLQLLLSHPLVAERDRVVELMEALKHGADEIGAAFCEIATAAAADDEPFIGGKAAKLARLAQAGLGRAGRRCRVVG